MILLLNTPYTRWDDDGRPIITAVWVKLDALYFRIPGAPSHEVSTGLVMSGEVPGRLHGWLPGVKGDWLGVVDFAIPFADWSRDPLEIADQLVPAYALRPNRTSVAEDEPGVGHERGSG